MKINNRKDLKKSKAHRKLKRSIAPEKLTEMLMISPELLIAD